MLLADLDLVSRTHLLRLCCASPFRECGGPARTVHGPAAPPASPTATASKPAGSYRMVSSGSSASGPPACCHCHVESAWQPGRLGRHRLTFTVTNWTQAAHGRGTRRLTAGCALNQGGSRPGGPSSSAASLGDRDGQQLWCRSLAPSDSQPDRLSDSAPALPR